MAPEATSSEKGFCKQIQVLKGVLGVQLRVSMDCYGFQKGYSYPSAYRHFRRVTTRMRLLKTFPPSKRMGRYRLLSV